MDIKVIYEDNHIIVALKPQNVPSQAYLNLSPEALAMQNVLWEELKAKSSIGNGIYVGCGVILGVLTFIGVYQLIKKRRWAKLYD